MQLRFELAVRVPYPTLNVTSPDTTSFKNLEMETASVAFAAGTIMLPALAVSVMNTSTPLAPLCFVKRDANDALHAK